MLQKMLTFMVDCEMHNAQRTTHNAQRTTHNAQRTTHNAQRTTHNAQRTTHNAQRTTHNAQRTTHLAYLLTFFLIYLFAPKDMFAQSIQCGNPDLTTREMDELLGKLGRKDLRSMDCTNPVWSGGNQTYNLILEYAHNQTHTDSIKKIADYIISSFAQIGISFNITLKPSANCNNCFTGIEQEWGFAWDTPTYSNCIYGRMAKGYAVDGYSGHGNPNGTFISRINKNIVVHELGHALGLLHTFQGFTDVKHEYVRQDGINCECNCLVEGDLVCDTRNDPYFSYGNWNSYMFSEDSVSIVNENDETDNCGVNYRDNVDHASVMRNFMSYHRSSNLDRFTTGQGDLIKIINQGKPWLSPNSGGSIISTLTSVDVPTTISENTVFNDDLTLNSSLTFENCTVSIAKDKKIIMNNGSKLVLKNAVVQDLDAGSCLTEAGEWGGIVVDGRATIRLRDHSVIKKSQGALISKLTSPGLLAVLVEDGSELYNENKSILYAVGNTYMRVNNGTLTGDVHIIDIANGLSSFEISRSVLAKGRFMLQNVGVEVTSSTLARDADMFLNNSMSIKKIYFNNNTINSAYFRVDGSDGVFKFNSNEVYTFINLRNINDFDLYNNVFLGKGNIKFDHDTYNASKNLIFKNTFDQTSAPKQNYSLYIEGNYTGTAIECNDFKYNTTDLIISSFGAIADRQGDDNMAAGNSFSRNNPEVYYESNTDVNYHYLNQGTEKPVNISGVNSSNFKPNQNDPSSGSKCDLSYPQPPKYPNHCGNNIKDGDEEMVDCGGSCKPCKHILDDIDRVISVGADHCSDGVRNHDETGIDCGGSNCPPCDTCNDGIMNNGETGIDCGGPYCPPCNTEYCNNGIQDNGETDIDCGGPCSPCGDPPSVSYCNNGIQDNGETGIDCGGPCSPCQIILYVPSCYNGVQDYGETGIDCGGPCPDCLTWTVTGTGGPIIVSGIGSGNGVGTGTGTGEGIGNNIDSTLIKATWYKRHTAALSKDFIDELHQHYGAGFISLGEDLDIRVAKRAMAAQMDDGSTPQLIALIKSDSQTDAANVLSALRLASPYVSASAIHALFEQSVFFTQAEIADILMRNPGLVSDPYVHDVVYNSGSITGMYKSDILNAIAMGDQRMQSEEAIRIRDHYMQALMRNHLMSAMEGFTPDYNEMRSLLLKKDDYMSVFEIYETFIAEGQYQFADTYISMWDPNDISDPYFKEQLLQFQTVHAILYKYYYAGNRSVTMANGDRVLLETIAEGCYGKATLKARSVLTDLFEADFEVKPICNPYPSLVFAPGTQIRTSDDIKYAVRPNPVSEYLEVMCFDRACQNATLTVYDINGLSVGNYSIKKAQETKIDVSSLVSGVYIYKIISGTQYVQTGKFIKIK